ncbi:hypothetical protein BU23DRAFT_285994 [Bimuria novae-zelandiae CBS 107.79]|uniref:RGS domain-containing protein n=1 Tax=Bimuria novae-zelandiae CBS 107.79 TaxID=1447943 RepID=A0A6A5UUR3_9PLEO|nr:hypothetical protein BU23DRAFT_285994 [Bimuria novae-zelandiae CBS 107.79]
MAQLLLDLLGWAYIGLDIAWTVALLCGMVFLFYHRELPCIRMRRLPVLFAGTIALHLYGFACILGYPIGPVVPCVAIFWVMSIYLPFGIAMFHAANSQFLHVASRQKQFAHLSLLSDHTPLKQEEAERLSNSRWRRILRGLERADRIDRMMLCIGLGLVVQLLLTFLVFFGSKKFHPSYGLWDWDSMPSNPELVAMECSKGWEWWLSIVWQFFWAWIYAPYMLWKSRGINDVHGWRLQTICCCVVGLPASPLWLAGLYAPGMMTVNASFIPPMWFSLSIFAMEVITIGFPIVEIVQTNRLRQETLDVLADWEQRQHVALPSSSAFSASSTKGGARSSFTINELHFAKRTSLGSHPIELYTMAGLEKALRTNPVPLLHFAALRDFSGENISFLTHLAEWRRSWLNLTMSTAQHRRQQFIAAVSVYAHFVSPSFSEFPINIVHQNMTVLRELFEEPASRIFRKLSLSSGYSPTPFEDVSPDSDSTIELRSGVNLDTLRRVKMSSVAHMARPGYEDVLTDYPIPEAFKETVFDAAEKEIKYLVLTNTWSKFINDIYATSLTDVEKEPKHGGWFKRSVLCGK